MAHAGKTAHLLRIIYLLSTRQGVSRRLLSEECGVCDRTVYRYIQTLAESGVPIYYDQHGQCYRFTEKIFLKPLTFSVAEATAMLQCLQAFGRAANPLAPYLRQAQEKILGSLPLPQQRQVDELCPTVDIAVAPRQQGVGGDVFGCVQGAISKRKRLFITYYTKSRDTMSDRKVDPYVISFRGAAWYLVAFCHQRQQVKMFRLDRIRRLAVLEESYEWPRHFSAAQFFAGSWLLEQGELMHVILRFAPEAARWVREGHYHPSQRLTDLPGGALRYEVTVKGWWEITRWILGFGPLVEVIAPSKLRRKVAALLAKASGQYGDDNYQQG